MRECVKEYISQFNDILNLVGVCWWIIDFQDDPDYYYCNDLMKETFSLDKNAKKHSVSKTCPIAGDYNKNIALATSVQEKAKLVFDEYKQLISQEIDEYNNKFPYYNKELDKTFYFNSRAKVLKKNEKNEISVLYGIIEDITSIEIQRKELEENSEIIDKHVMITTTDLKGIITSVSTSFCKASGYAKNELIGKNHNIVRHPETSTQTYRNMWLTIKSGQTWKGELRNKTKNGDVLWIYTVISPTFDDNNNIRGYTSIKNNITDKKIIENLSKRDKLTNLYNRVKIDDSLDTEIDRSLRHDSNLSVIILDIDNFKRINDKHGHIIGDKILIKFADILKDNVRKTDIVGRWGGEEFVIISQNTNLDAAKILAEKLRLAIDNFEFEYIKNSTASFGIAQFEKDDTYETLVNRADEALYKAKNNGKNRIEV